MSTADVAPPNASAPAHDPHALPYDPTGARIGMWLFLFTEILLFGALFIIYAVYLKQFTWQFTQGSAELSIPMGAINTIVLLTSSLSVVLAVAAIQRGDRIFAIRLIDFTMVCAAMFLVIKAFEWGAKFEHGLYPGSHHMLDLSQGEQIFFSLYFVMTGLHALHIILGMGVLYMARQKIKAHKITPERYVFLENAGLYWHLVDLVWIYLFPLFYLMH